MGTTVISYIQTHSHTCNNLTHRHKPKLIHSNNITLIHSYSHAPRRLHLLIGPSQTPTSKYAYFHTHAYLHSHAKTMDTLRCMIPQITPLLIQGHISTHTSKQTHPPFFPNTEINRQPKIPTLIQILTHFPSTKRPALIVTSMLNHAESHTNTQATSHVYS